MTENRAAIVALHRAGRSNSDIAMTLSIGRSTVWKTLKRFNKRGDLSDRPRSGRPRSQRSKPMIKRIQEKIRNPKRSIRRLAKTSEMSPRTMRRLVHEDLKMSSFTLQKRQALFAAVKQNKRLERSKILLKN